MARADTIIKSVSERPNGMFPPGNHVRTCGTSVTLSSERENPIFWVSENFSEILKIFQIFWNIFRISEIFSEILKYFQNFWNIFRNSEKFSENFRFSEKKCWFPLPRLGRGSARRGITPCVRLPARCSILLGKQTKLCFEIISFTTKFWLHENLDLPRRSGQYPDFFSFRQRFSFQSVQSWCFVMSCLTSSPKFFFKTRALSSEFSFNWWAMQK